MDKLKNWIQENIHKMDVDEPNAATWNHLKRGLSKSAESDPLKNHITENKNKLEIDIPDEASWEKISRFISAKRRMPVQRIKKSLIYLSAACIITIICLGVFRYINTVEPNLGKEIVKRISLRKATKASDTANIQESNNNQLIVKQPLPDQSLKQGNKNKSIAVAASKSAKKQKENSLPLEVLQIQKDYDQLIAGQIAYTKSLAVYGENPSYFQEFMNDFKALENQEKELRKSIAENGLQENSIDDLAMIYQQKLTVLKKLQNEINKTSKCNKDFTDTIPAYLKL
jgi:hypothetical protein